jgi:hypothetical protein
MQVLSFLRLIIDSDSGRSQQVWAKNAVQVRASTPGEQTIANKKIGNYPNQPAASKVYKKKKKKKKKTFRISLCDPRLPASYAAWEQGINKG